MLSTILQPANVIFHLYDYQIHISSIEVVVSFIIA